MGAGSDKAAAVTDFGLGSRDSHSVLTYRAVDLTVTLCLGVAILAVPIVLPWLSVPASVQRVRTATA